MHVKPALTTFDHTLETIAWLALAFLWGFVIYKYSGLPPSVPAHFNFAGEPDRYGHKTVLFLLPVIGTILFIVFRILTRRPLPVKSSGTISPENTQQLQVLSSRMLRFLNCAVMLNFGLITYETVRAVENQCGVMGPWMLPILLGSIMIPVTYFIVKMMRISKA